MNANSRRARNAQVIVMINSSGNRNQLRLKIRNPGALEPADTQLARRTLNARSKIYDLIVQFRNDAQQTESARAQALFEFSAELLAGMARSFRALEEELKETG